MRERLFTGSAIVLLVIASGALFLLWEQMQGLNPALVLSLLAFALFCINSGFSLPQHGYVSFDRVAQVSSILVLGPVPAAAINGLASFVFPFRRLLKGEPLRQVLDSSAANAGMMTLVILISGLVYQAAGGDIPIQELSAHNALALLLMAVCLHGLNELCMVWFMYLRTGSARHAVNVFGYAVELFSIMIGILLAAVLPVLPVPEFALLMIVLGVGMIILKQLAELRLSLSEKVAQRTRELEEKSAALNDLARRDSLTELLNRRAMDAWLAEAFHGSKSPQVSLALLDIDHFKSINDQHSHAQGDAVLIGVAELVAKLLGQDGVAARFGGDEFVVAVRGMARESLLSRFEELLEQLRTKDWAISDRPVRITASIGVALCREQDDPGQLLARADRRLYQAKLAGRNQVCAE